MKATAPITPFHDYKVFRFVSCDYEAATSTGYFRYAVDEEHFFEETFVFPKPVRPLSSARRALLTRCLFYLHLAAGISYYKALLPADIRVETGPLSAEAARFFTDFYFRGLGEFAYRNGLDLTGRIAFPATSEAPVSPVEAPLPRRTLVPVGGGKDSVVTVEVLKTTGEPITLVSVGDHPVFKEIADLAGRPLIRVRRRLSPALFALNQQGTLNGHVPITGILSFVFLTTAALYGFDSVALSAERSADSGNTRHMGIEVNHQWSKSQDFEGRLLRLIRLEISPHMKYFSLLRPLSELRVAGIFSTLAPYHDVFISCNRSFSLKKQMTIRWCGVCDKCRFVFFILAPFLPPAVLSRIFGEDLLMGEGRESAYLPLFGLNDIKPFECVGDVTDMCAALHLIRADSPYAAYPAIQMLSRRLPPSQTAQALTEALQMSGACGMPVRCREALHEACRSTWKAYCAVGSR